MRSFRPRQGTANLISVAAAGAALAACAATAPRSGSPVAPIAVDPPGPSEACPGSGAAIVDARRVVIRTVDGHLLTAVNDGGVGGPATGPAAAALHTDVSCAAPGPFETLTCVSAGDDRMAFRTAAGTYLTAVRGGGIGGPNADPYQVHTDATVVGPWEQFTLVRLHDGKCALKAPDGHWVTVVGGGGYGEAGNRMPIHTDATRLGPWETFTVAAVPPPAPPPPTECGVSSGDWCPAPAGDPCGQHRDVESCKADARCHGMRYRGESVAPCRIDERGFAQNCPTVGCFTPAR